MSFIAEKFTDISPSQTLAITAAAKKMRDEGQDIASFGAGEPDLILLSSSKMLPFRRFRTARRNILRQLGFLN